MEGLIQLTGEYRHKYSHPAFPKKIYGERTLRNYKRTLPIPFRIGNIQRTSLRD